MPHRYHDPSAVPNTTQNILNILNFELKRLEIELQKEMNRKAKEMPDEEEFEFFPDLFF